MQLTDIIANMRSYADRLDSAGGMPSPTDLRTFADGIDAAIREENHCEKRFDEDGNEMPPHCAFQSLRLDHALAERDALRKYIEKCRDYFADLTEAYNLEEERKLLEEARALLNETKGE